PSHSCSIDAAWTDQLGRSGGPFAGLATLDDGGTDTAFKKERGTPLGSYRRAAKRQRRKPLLRRRFGSSLQKQAARGRFWRTPPTYPRPTLRRGRSWIQRCRL